MITNCFNPMIITYKPMKQKAGYFLSSLKTKDRVAYEVRGKTGGSLFWMQYLDAKDYFDLKVIEARDKLTRDEQEELDRLFQKAYKGLMRATVTIYP